MVIPELDVILKGSPYEDMLPNYKKFLEQSKIVTVQDLENCPRYAGPNLCGHSTYEFVAFVRDATINYEEPKAEPVKAPPKARKKKVSSKPKLVEEPVVVEPVVEADSDKDAQSSEKE